MGRLFLPGQVVSAENQGTFSDYHWLEARTRWLAFAGGAYWDGYVCGIFAQDLYGAEYYGSEGGTEVVCSRLSKN